MLIKNLYSVFLEFLHAIENTEVVLHKWLIPKGNSSLPKGLQNYYKYLDLQNNSELIISELFRSRSF